MSGAASSGGNSITSLVSAAGSFLPSSVGVRNRPPCPEELKGARDLGWMLYDMDYTDPENIRPLFFRASLEDGVLRVPDRNSGEVRG